VSSWPLVPLGEIFEIARGGSPRPIEKYVTDDPNGINWIMIGDASEGTKYISATRKRIRPEGASRSRSVKPGDFLLTNSMSFGHPYIMRTTGCIHDGWLVLAKKRIDVDPDFFYYLLGSQAIYSEFERRAAGATVKNLNIELVRGVRAPLPPIAVQRRIADVLDRAEALRAKRRAALARLGILGQSVFLDLFGDPVSNRHGWSTSTIGEIADQVTDGEHLTPRRTSDGVKLLSARNIRDGYIDFDNVDYIDMEEFERIKARCCPRIGDVLISCSGSIGRVAAVDGSEPFALVRSAALVRPRRTVVETKFLEHYLRTPALNRRMLQRANASSQANLFQGQIRELPVFLPPLELQREFARRLAAIEKLKSLHRASLAKLDELFASLQHRAFRGEL
jgi:type I restriction enzyme S subunit